MTKAFFLVVLTLSGGDGSMNGKRVEVAGREFDTKAECEAARDHLAGIVEHPIRAHRLRPGEPWVRKVECAAR